MLESLSFMQIGYDMDIMAHWLWRSFFPRISYHMYLDSLYDRTKLFRAVYIRKL